MPGPVLSIDVPLKRGDSGPVVKLLQEWLCLRLSPPHPAEVATITAIDGDFGPSTEAAVKMFQAGLDAPRTGIIEPSQFAQLVEPMALALSRPLPRGTLGETVCAVAEEHLKHGPREVGGQNRGPWVRLYCGGLDGEAYSWCAGFASFVLHQAARLRRADSPILPELGCDNLARDAQRRDALLVGGGLVPPVALKPGDLFLVRAAPGADRRYHHTGIVTGIERDHVRTIEGNTNEGGSPNGFGVFARERGYRGLDFIAIDPPRRPPQVLA